MICSGGEMKLKTITFLVIALSCFFSPATSYAVMSVRSLGGAGTFNGTDAAKSVAQENVARIGVMRIGDTTGGRGASARSASTSRLAIGKYLGGTSSVSGSAAVVKPVDPGQSGVTEVSKDIKDLRIQLTSLILRDTNRTYGYNKHWKPAIHLNHSEKSYKK